MSTEPRDITPTAPEVPGTGPAKPRPGEIIDRTARDAGRGITIGGAMPVVLVPSVKY